MNNALRELPVRKPLSPQSLSVLRTLLYFDIFNYPLTFSEIQAFCGIHITSSDLYALEMDRLVDDGLVYRFGEFYTLHHDAADIERRLKGNQEAARHVPLAQQKARFISRFPFVRAVMISGSLSKGYMDEKSDLDFFVVTAPNRLWIARTLFVLYRKAFVPKQRHKEFCTNYFLAADKLEIEERNLFTATELATLIPVTGTELYIKLISANSWMSGHLPNFVVKEDWDPNPGSPTRLKGFAEKVFSVLFGRALNQWLMNISLRRFQRKYGPLFSKADFALALKTKPFVSKVHLSNNQNRVLSLLQSKMKEFESKTAVAFDHG